MSRTTKSVLDLVVVCPKCKTGYIPENGEICNCPESILPLPWDGEELIDPLEEAHLQ